MARVQSRPHPASAAPEDQPSPRISLHLAFWLLLFVLFPLVTMPKALLERVPTGLITFPEDGFAEVLIPKLLVFALLWGLGARLLYGRAEGRSLVAPGSPLRAPFTWLGLFLLASFVVSLLNPSSLGLSLPLIDSRHESVVFGLLEIAWYALSFITAGLVASRVLRVSLPLHLLALGACGAGAWALLEAYGVDPMRLVDPGARVGYNVQASLGHQGYVAAFLAVALVFWTSWRLLGDQLRLLDIAIIALLTASLVASGGRAGLLAALLTLSVLAVYWLRQHKKTRYLLLLGGLMALVSAATLLTSPHAQGRLQRLSSAVQGQDPATSHRFVFWQVGVRAILERPLTGYGIDAFGNAAWWFATPEQADEMLSEFLPDEDPADIVRIGKLALYRRGGELAVRAVEPYRVHNYLLDLAFASGVPVALLFLAFVLSSLRALYRARTALAWAAALSLVTYLLYGMAWFATPNVDPLVWGLLGVGLGSVLSGER